MIGTELISKVVQYLSSQGFKIAEVIAPDNGVDYYFIQRIDYPADVNNPTNFTVIEGKWINEYLTKNAALQATSLLESFDQAMDLLEPNKVKLNNKFGIAIYG